LSQDRAYRQLIWYLFAGSRGGITRAKMVKLLKEGNYNANKIAEMLSLDYKTVQHHLKVLRKNNITRSDSEGYGAEYKLTDYFIANFSVFAEIWSKLESGEKVFKPR
jgi:DNA-binding transcriptional ArsR family regulator